MKFIQYMYMSVYRYLLEYMTKVSITCPSAQQEIGAEGPKLK